MPDLARWFRTRDLIYCHGPSCHIPACHLHPQGHGYFPTPASPRRRGRRQCHHGKPNLSLLPLWAEAAQHLTAATQPSSAPPPPAAQHISLPTRLGEVCGQQRASGAEQQWDPWLSLALPQHSPVRSVVLWGALRGCRGPKGVAGLPYRVQYHSFRHREQRLAASTPHTLQRGLSGARASIMSRL